MSAKANSSAVVDSDITSSSPNDKSRLGQPKDAVPMQNINQPSSSNEGLTSANGDRDPNSNPNPETTATAVADNDTTPPTAEATTAADPDTAKQPTTAQGKDADSAPQPPLKDRQDSIMAIGPAQDEITSVAQGSQDHGPVCNITLLLTTGSRHPYKIDARYLSRRNVPIPEENEQKQPDPFSISIYTLKELILREWRSDWETKPASPSSIRLIHFGKLLDDKEPLKTYHFSAESPNVVHMSIRPQDLDEEEPKSGGKNHSSGGGDSHRQRNGGCCVVL